MPNPLNLYYFFFDKKFYYLFFDIEKLKFQKFIIFFFIALNTVDYFQEINYQTKSIIVIIKFKKKKNY
jgi:hypothetical protein